MPGFRVRVQDAGLDSSASRKVQPLSGSVLLSPDL